MSFAICLSNRGYEASLELRKLYEILPDDGAVSKGMLRVIDESENSYLYPSAMFVPLQLPKNLEVALKVVSGNNLPHDE